MLYITPGFLPLSTTNLTPNPFACILNNTCRVLHKLLQLIRITRYSMHPRSHNRARAPQ